MFFLTLLCLPSSQHVNPIANGIYCIETSGAKSAAFGGTYSLVFSVNHVTSSCLVAACSCGCVPNNFPSSHQSYLALFVYTDIRTHVHLRLLLLYLTSKQAQQKGNVESVSVVKLMFPFSHLCWVICQCLST